MHWKRNTKDYLKSQEQQANMSKSLMQCLTKPKKSTEIELTFSSEPFFLQMKHLITNLSP